MELYIFNYSALSAQPLIIIKIYVKEIEWISIVYELKPAQAMLNINTKC